MALYYDASAEYYRHTKDYQAALLYIDSALIKMKQFESAQMEYAKQLSRKADILQEMGKYAEALPAHPGQWRIGSRGLKIPNSPA